MEKKRILLFGSNSSYLIKGMHNFNVKTVFTKKFPDGETYVRLPPEIKGSDVVYVQNFYPNQNDSLVESILTLEGLQQLGSKVKGIIAPYFPYARQDKSFLEGEVVSFRAIIKLFASLGVLRIGSLNTHAFKKPGIYRVEGVEFHNEDASSLLTSYFEGKKFLAVAPDKGAEHLVSRFDQRVVLEKKRGDYVDYRSTTQRPVERIVGKISKNVEEAVIFDDMISTGGTIAKATRFLLSHGIKKVSCATVHGLFVGDAVKKLKDAGINEIVATNSVKSEFSKVSIAPILQKLASTFFKL